MESSGKENSGSTGEHATPLHVVVCIGDSRPRWQLANIRACKRDVPSYSVDGGTSAGKYNEPPRFINFRLTSKWHIIE